MAKKRKGKIKIPLSIPDNSNVVQLSRFDLPGYHHFVDAPDHRFRVFFEEPKSLSDTKDPERPTKRFLRKPHGNKPFRIMSEGKALVGEDIARTFAVLLSKKILNGSITDNKQHCRQEHTALKSFFEYLATLSEMPTLFSDISVVHLSGWLSQISEGSSGTLKVALKGLIALHPLMNELDLSVIRRAQQVPKSKRLDEIDFDEIVKAKDYSERVHFQLLAYVFFEIENAEKRLEAFEQASPKMLGDDYIQPAAVSTENPIIRRLLETGEEGLKKLKYHLYFHLAPPSSDKKKKAIPNFRGPASTFVQRIQAIGDSLFKDSDNPKENYHKFKAYLESSEPNNWPLNESSRSPAYSYLDLTSKHHELAILIYTLITLGVNQEVALSWQWKLNGRPWYENYDIELGISSKTAARDKKVVLVGLKQKGRTPTVVKKSVSINSPLFNYLKLLDKSRPAGRQYIFNFGDPGPYMTAFLRHYPVIDDDGNRLKTLETTRIRKSYIGYKTLSLLEGVKNSTDLVLKLREALNHKSFDTTFSSYIMKSGMARTVVDSAIVALTTNMLENAMSFSGEIKEDNERSKQNATVFLCDCSDPSNPTHGLPIAERCTRYDMCLGCERSEVYSEHLPAICYRILQYEKKQEEAPEVFKITLEDRLYIAKDTVEQFKVRHSRGIDLVEQSYLIANQAMLDDEPLLPPILQTGAL